MGAGASWPALLSVSLAASRQGKCPAAPGALWGRCRRGQGRLRLPCQAADKVGSPKIASRSRLCRAVKRAIFVPFRQAAWRLGRRKLRRAGFVIILAALPVRQRQASTDAGGSAPEQTKSLFRLRFVRPQSAPRPPPCRLPGGGGSSSLLSMPVGLALLGNGHGPCGAAR